MSDNVRSYRWVFTLNNPTDEEIDKLSTLDCTYLLYGKEHQNEGTPHLQGYVVFQSQKRFSTLKRFNERIHWEKARGNHAQNIAYCTKEDTEPYEKGERPVDIRKRKTNLVEEIEKDPRHGLTIYNNKRMIESLENEQKMFEEIISGLMEKPEVVYIYGDTGTGKTYWAINDAVQRYGKDNVSMLRFCNSFGISNNPMADALIIPEFRPSCIDAATFLEFTDGYGMVLNIKHSQVYIRPRAIYICSIKHPHEIYKDEINEQFRRRITRFVDKNNDPYIP